MRSSITLAVAAAAAGAMAQDQSICDKYTSALFESMGGNTGANQYTLLNLLVNRVVIGNFSAEMTNDVNVPGILAKGEVNGQEVSLMKYFDGTLESTNRGGNAVSVNFLADGGAEPLMMNPPKPANTEDSPQYHLLTHLYQFFGALLGCTMDGFPSYEGNPSMEAAHRFMDLDANENNYFIMQVGLAAKSFGVEDSDITTVANSLNSTFNYRCSAPVMITSEEPELQSICQAESCPLAENATCDAYPNNGMATEPTPTPGAPGSPTGSNPAPTTGAATAVSVSASAGLFGLLAAFFL